MITESSIGGSIAVSITSEVKVVAIVGNVVILESMGEQAHLEPGSKLEVKANGIFNLEAT